MSKFCDPAPMTTTLTYDTFGLVLKSPASRLAWFHQFHRQRIIGLIGRVSLGLLSPEDLEDAYQDAMYELYGVLRRKPLAAEEYLPFLQWIARCKGIDALRRRGHRHLTNAMQNVLQISVSFADPQPECVLCEQDKPAGGQDLAEVLLSVLEELPRRQRLVARAYLDHFQEFGERDVYRRLAEVVSGVTGQPEKAETVKSLWFAARQTLGAALKRRGYSLREAMAP